MAGAPAFFFGGRANCTAVEWKGALGIRGVADDGEGRARGVGRSLERQLQHHAEAIVEEHWHNGQCRIDPGELDGGGGRGLVVKATRSTHNNLLDSVALFGLAV